MLHSSFSFTIIQLLDFIWLMRFLTLVLLLTDISAKKHHYLSFNIFDENDVEMFGIIIGQYSSAQYAL